MALGWRNSSKRCKYSLCATCYT